MERERTTESFCPMGIILFPALVGGLVWLCTLMGQM
jgi:hypothetical protein